MNVGSEGKGTIKVTDQYNLANLNVGRAIACIIVFIHHFLLAFYKIPVVLINDGNLAVCFFLILCGFILPIKIFKNKDTVPDDARRKAYTIFLYIIKRYLRLFTVVALCNLIAYLILCGGGTIQHNLATLIQ